MTKTPDDGNLVSETHVETSALVLDYGEESPALDVLRDYLKNAK